MQVTVAKIAGYGPWTLTQGHDREHRLQILQASLYVELQRLFAEKGGLVFPNRHDEFVIASGKLDTTTHHTIMDTIDARFEVSLQMHAGIGDTPYAANEMAYRARQKDVFVEGSSVSDNNVIIMHMDVDDLTSKTGTETPYDTSVRILELYWTMARYFRERQSLSFFMGGDNFMILSSEAGVAAAATFVEHVRQSLQMTLNCGIGQHTTPRQAAALATRSLDTIRQMRSSGEDVPRVYEYA